MELEETGEITISELPITVLRPSIIVGHSQTGWTSALDTVLYPAFYIIYRNKLTHLPNIDGYSRIDLVPVDFVTAAVHHFITHPRLEDIVGRTFHITSHPDDNLLVSDLVAACKRGFEELSGGTFKPKGTQFVSHRKFAVGLTAADFKGLLPRQQKIRQDERNKQTTIHDYTKTGGHPFDTTQARALLEPTGIIAPHFADYLPNILRFAVESGWRTPAVFSWDISKKVKQLPGSDEAPLPKRVKRREKKTTPKKKTE